MVILLTTYRDPPLLSDILDSLKKTEYPKCEILTVDCNSTRVRQILEAAGLEVPVHYIAIQKDRGAAHQLNVGMRMALDFDDAKYIVRIEGDAIPLDPKWLHLLVDVMEIDPKIAIAMPFDTDKNGKLGYGGRLYGNCTFAPISWPPSEICPCLGTGGHCFITRRRYVQELFERGIKPYWSPFYISSEDLDFNLKAWLRSYKVVTVGSTRVLHEGTSMPKSGSYRAPYRVYHMYKNRVCLLLLNFGFKHILVNIWYRLLHDVTSALLHFEVVLMLRGYLWLITNMRQILFERKMRMVYWKRIRDKELKRHVLVKLPLPIKK